MKFKKFIPIFVIIVLMIGAYFLGVADYFTFEQLKSKHETLTQFVNDNFLLASGIFILTYIVSTALSLPIGIYLTFIGGFLFPQPLSTIFVVVGATTGACILFVAAKTALYDLLRKKASPFLSKMEKGFNENAASYLLFLRLVPAFPFWLVNIAPALVGVSFITYLWTTAVGILPGVFVFTQFGAGLGSVFEGREEFHIDNVINRDVKIALVALAIFVLIPVVIKKFRKRKSDVGKTPKA